MEKVGEEGEGEGTSMGEKVPAEEMPYTPQRGPGNPCRQGGAAGVTGLHGLLRGRV